MVRAVVPSGKYRGVHTGRVIVQAKGNFVIKKGRVLVCEASPIHLRAIQRSDGHAYDF
jgi:hypothetical protein